MRNSKKRFRPPIFYGDSPRCPLQAGLALREAARTGLLAAYLPEFKAISGIVALRGFPQLPRRRAYAARAKALERLCGASVAFAPALIQVLERVSDPHVLVLAILFHDLGKACGEKHVEDSVRLADAINGRIGVDPYDAERILLLVRHHMLMSNIALYRDTDDLDVITSFAKTVKTDDLLRMLLLLTYADLMAVAPNVWNEWKGALLLKLFLKTQRILTGRSEHAFDEALIQPKLDSVRILAEAEQMRDVDGYLNGLSERYILGYAPEQIVTHMKCHGRGTYLRHRGRLYGAVRSERQRSCDLHAGPPRAVCWKIAGVFSSPPDKCPQRGPFHPG